MESTGKSVEVSEICRHSAPAGSLGGNNPSHYGIWYDRCFWSGMKDKHSHEEGLHDHKAKENHGKWL